MRSSSNNTGNTHRVPRDDPADVPVRSGPTIGDHVVNRSIFRQSLCVKELPVIYGEQAAAFMEFVSAEYEARDWTPG